MERARDKYDFIRESFTLSALPHYFFYYRGIHLLIRKKTITITKTITTATVCGHALTSNVFSVSLTTVDRAVSKKKKEEKNRESLMSYAWQQEKEGGSGDTESGKKEGEVLCCSSPTHPSEPHRAHFEKASDPTGRLDDLDYKISKYTILS